MSHIESVLLLLALPVTNSTTIALEAGGKSTRPPETAALKICGARCVHFVSEHFCEGQTDLVEIVRDVHGTDLQTPVSLERVASALRRRGIHVAGIRVPPSTQIVWHHPVIVQMHPTCAPDGGHFAVWLPSSSTTRTQLQEELGQVEIDTQAFLAGFSGYALLTSDTPIMIPHTDRELPAICASMAFLAAVICAGLCATRLFRSA